MDGVGVVGAVGEAGRDGDGAFRREDEFELKLAFHHGVHVGAFLPCSEPWSGPVQGESAVGAEHYAGSGNFFRT
ncbi:hypothetical protein GCM10009837_14560 [Streptomyces durmitorensis]